MKDSLKDWHKGGEEPDIKSVIRITRENDFYQRSVMINDIFQGLNWTMGFLKLFSNKKITGRYTHKLNVKIKLLFLS